MTSYRGARLLVIFGAGASYDSIRSLTTNLHLDDRPPLAAELFGGRFDRMVAAHPACGALVAHLRALPASTSLETELDRIRTEELPRSSLRRRQVISLRYYLRDVLAEAEGFARRAPAQTNYHLLLEQLLLWQERSDRAIAFVTFNYDTMLETAVSDLTGWSLADIGSYVAHPELMIYKPHGSVNWSQLVANERGGISGDARTVEGRVLDLAGSEELTLTGEIQVLNSAATGLATGDRLVMPAVTVPVQRKQDFEFPRDHQEALARSLSEGSGPTKVVTIGWRGGEESFLRFWLKNHGPSQPELLAVNGHQDQGLATAKALQDAKLRFSDITALSGGFSHLVGQPLHTFLET